MSEKLGVLMNATVLATLGHLAATRRDYADAGKLLDHGRTLLAEVRGDDLAGYDRLQYLLTAALLYNCQHDHDGAAQLFTNGLAVARRAQDWSPLLVSLYDLALARQAQGDLAGAAEHLQEGLALAAQAGDETSAAYYLEVLAAVAAQQDNPRRAVRLFAAARSILDARGSGWLHAFVPRVPHDDAALAALRSPSATRHSTRPRRGAGPPGANLRWNTHSRSHDPPRSSTAGAAGAARARTGQDAASGRRRQARAELGQAREAAGRQVRQDAARDQAGRRGAGKPGSRLAGDARAARRARAEQAEAQLQRARADHDQAAGQAASNRPRPGTPPPALARKPSDEQPFVQNIAFCAATRESPSWRRIRPYRRLGARSPEPCPSLSVALPIGITSRPTSDPAPVG